MFKADDYFYKIPINKRDLQSLKWYTKIFRYHGDTSFVDLTEIMVLHYPFLVKYHAVRYDSLSRTEAKRCLGHLVLNLHQALSRLHDKLEVYHNNIRLEYICFQDDYSLMLIDMDRSVDARGRFDISCIYEDVVCMTPCL